MTLTTLVAPGANPGGELPTALFSEMEHEEVLALAPKPYVNLGQFVVNTYPRVVPNSFKAKHPNSTEVSDLAIETNSNDEIILTAHEVVMGSLLEHLGEDLFTRSTVYFTHRNWGVPKARSQAAFSKIWHVDGFSDPGRVKAMVMYFDQLATSILHNSVKPTDLDAKGELLSIQGVPLAEATTVEEELPKDHLLLLPNIPHRAKVADRWVPQRRFMRWVVVDEVKA